MYFAGLVVFLAGVWQVLGRPEFLGQKEIVSHLESFVEGKDPLDAFFATEDYNDMTAIFNGMDSTYLEDLFEAESTRKRGYGDYAVSPQIVDYALLVGKTPLDAVPGLNYVNNPNNPASNSLNGFPVN